MLIPSRAFRPIKIYPKDLCERNSNFITPPPLGRITLRLKKGRGIKGNILEFRVIANVRVYVRRSKFKMIFNFSLRRRVPRRTWSEATYRYSRSRKIKKHLNLQEHAH